MTDKTTNDKSTFILRCEYYAQVKILTREQRGDLLTAIFAYASGEDIPEMDGVTYMCFEFIRASIDSYTDKYNAKRMKNSENGKKGGRPRSKPDGFDENRADSDESQRMQNEESESEKTERFFNNETESDGTERLKKKHDNDSVFDSDNELYCRITEHTHSKGLEKGGVGENNAAHDLLSWTATHYPAVMRMQDPLTEQQAKWLLRRYGVEDTRRLIAVIDNKGATKNKSAYTTIVAFAKCDRNLQQKQELLTYEQVCDLVPTKAKVEDFERVQADGRPMWRRKNQ